MDGVIDSRILAQLSPAARQELERVMQKASSSSQNSAAAKRSTPYDENVAHITQLIAANQGEQLLLADIGERRGTQTWELFMLRMAVITGEVKVTPDELTIPVEKHLQRGAPGNYNLERHPWGERFTNIVLRRSEVIEFDYTIGRHANGYQRRMVAGNDLVAQYFMNEETAFWNAVQSVRAKGGRLEKYLSVEERTLDKEYTNLCGRLGIAVPAVFSRYAVQAERREQKAYINIIEQRLDSIRDDVRGLLEDKVLTHPEMRVAGKGSPTAKQLFDALHTIFDYRKSE
jgi:hypothetical protein